MIFRKSVSSIVSPNLLLGRLIFVNEVESVYDFLQLFHCDRSSMRISYTLNFLKRFKDHSAMILPCGQVKNQISIGQRAIMSQSGDNRNQRQDWKFHYSRSCWEILFENWEVWRQLMNFWYLRPFLYSFSPRGCPLLVGKFRWQVIIWLASARNNSKYNSTYSHGSK